MCENLIACIKYCKSHYMLMLTVTLKKNYKYVYTIIKYTGTLIMYECIYAFTYALYMYVYM